MSGTLPFQPKVASLTKEDMTVLYKLLYRWTGMSFGESKRYFIERRIGDRMLKGNYSDPKSYLAFASGNLDERQALINAFTINETYFYREDHQFSALSREILPDLIRSRRPGDPVRIWSMPCSTGEEAYSIALWLLENWTLVDAYNIEIIGSDIDTVAIGQAREGRFGARSLARLPKRVVEEYFEAERGHRRKIIDDLRESVRFIAANIVDPTSLSALGRFDIIFCRNLLIYLDDKSRQIAANNLFDCLRPGGYLCLGHSESMARITDNFDMVRLENAIVYRKP